MALSCLLQFSLLWNIIQVSTVLSTRGIVRTVAGGGSPHKGAKTDCIESATAVDGYSNKARFNYPWGIVFDAGEENLYVADCGCPNSIHTNDRIRNINLSTGKVTTIAGSASGYRDGIGKAAQFHHSAGMALDTRSRMLYVADTGNDRIRKIDLQSANVTTYAGSGVSGFVDNTGTKAQFNNPQSLTIDMDGNQLFLSDTDNHAIRIISLKDGMVSTLAGGSLGLDDGFGKKAKFYHPTGIAYDKENDILYVADHFNHVIRMIHAATGKVTTLAGGGREGFRDGIGKNARFNYPEGLSYDLEHKILYVVEFDNNAVRMVTQQGKVTTLAGGGEEGYRDGIGRRAQFFHPTGLTFDHKNKIIYVTDQYNHMIRSISGLGAKDDGTLSGLSARFNITDPGFLQALIFSCAVGLCWLWSSCADLTGREDYAIIRTERVPYWKRILRYHSY